MVTRVSDTNHVRSTRIVRLDESLMKVARIAAYTIRSLCTTSAPWSLRICAILSIRNLDIPSRADWTILRIVSRYRNYCYRAVTFRVSRRSRSNVDGTRGRRERLILFLDQGLLSWLIDVLVR